jgi:hypothetical protein
MALLRGPNISAAAFSRDSVEERGLVLHGDLRTLLTYLLRDGIAVDLLGGFEALAARPRWSVTSIVAHVLGDAFELHDDPRGVFVFPYRIADCYDEIAAGDGFWAAAQPAYPSQQVGDFPSFSRAYGALEESSRRLVLGLPPKK